MGRYVLYNLNLHFFEERLVIYTIHAYSWFKVDLSKSAAGLIFDTEPTGRGVEVFQPLEVTQGADFLVEAPVTQDGASKTELVVSELPPSGAIRFTVDVDDTLTASDLGQIRVSGSEIVGAEVRLGEIIAVFDETGRALLTVACETA